MKTICMRFVYKHNEHGQCFAGLAQTVKPNVLSKLQTKQNRMLKGYDLPFRELKTIKGVKKVSEIYSEVYKPLGLVLDASASECNAEQSEILPMKYTVQCSQLFSDWLATLQKSKNPAAVPPKTIPSDQLERFLTANYSKLQTYYFANENWLAGRGWSFTKKQYEQFFEKYKNENFDKMAYGNNGSKSEASRFVQASNFKSYVNVKLLKLSSERVITCTR